MAHIAHQPGPVCLEGGVGRWLVGVVGLGVALHQRPHAARGALLPFECLRKTRGVQALRGGPGRPGRLAGMAELAPLFPGGPGGANPLLCHRPTSHIKCARRRP
jgi:hypothetical protein